MKSIVKIVLIVSISIMVLYVIYASLDYLKHRSLTINCNDGVRQTIDYKDIQLQYSSNKISLDIEIMDKFKARPEIDPKILQTAAESTQNWDQFLKGLISGYNSCAVSKKDYARILETYKKIEEITKSLKEVLKKNPLTEQDVETAMKLIEQYTISGKEFSAKRLQ